MGWWAAPTSRSSRNRLQGWGNWGGALAPRIEYVRGEPNHANPATHLRTVDEPRGIATLLEDPAEAHLGLRLLGRGILLLVCEGEQGGGKEEGKRLYGGSFKYRLAKINYCETNLSNWGLVL